MEPMDENKPIALEAYQEIADRYSDLAESKAENGYIEHPAMRAALGPVNGLNVLDAGCGPGFLVKHLLKGGASVTGFDVSPRMIELAGRRTGGKARLFVADMAKEMPQLKDGEFDLVASSLAIDYVKNWTVPLKTFHRALKPGGRFVFSVQHPLAAFLWYKPPTAYGVHYVQARWKGFGGDPVLMPDYYRSFEEMINPLIAGGFRVKKVSDTRPIELLMESAPQIHEKYSRHPTFMVIQAEREG